jgi:hypothetical protein
MSRFPRGLDAAYLQHEHEERMRRVLAIAPGRPSQPLRIVFEGRELLALPNGAIARVDGGDPGDESD